MKKAFITGAYGQDGAYLTHYLLSLGYFVIGGRRRSSILNTYRIDYFRNKKQNFDLFVNYRAEYIDMTDSASLVSVINKYEPDEIYNLAAQSHVGISFELPEYTSNVNGIGFLKLLEVVRSKKNYDPKIYQASTSELFGDVKSVPQNEKTLFNPISPYGISKHFAHQIAVHYRKTYSMKISCGILFNHESPLRGDNFVTKKIVTGIIRFLNNGQKLDIGNLNSLRDWGHAIDYVKLQHTMLNNSEPDDFVIATGKQYSVKKFIELVCLRLGVEVKWTGDNTDELGIVKNVSHEAYKKYVGDIIVYVNKKNIRPSDVINLLGDPKKAMEKLGYLPKSDLNNLITEMIEHEIITNNFILGETK
jgi:GDPmannose 4,6-dehydratase